MAQRNVSTTVASTDGHTSGAALDVLTDTNALTLAGAAVGAVTAGGALFVGAAVAPSQVLGGALAAATLCVGGEVKNRTGSYLPFLDEKDTTQAEASA